MKPFIPTREYLESIQLGSFAPTSLGPKHRMVIEILHQGLDVNDKYFVCWYHEFGVTSKITMSMKEGEPVETISGQLTEEQVSEEARYVISEKRPLYVVLSRDNSSFIFATHEKRMAISAQNHQMELEEIGGGKPSIYITETEIK